MQTYTEIQQPRFTWPEETVQKLLVEKPSTLIVTHAQIMSSMELSLEDDLKDFLGDVFYANFGKYFMW